VLLNSGWATTKKLAFGKMCGLIRLC